MNNNLHAFVVHFPGLIKRQSLQSCLKVLTHFMIAFYCIILNTMPFYPVFGLLKWKTVQNNQLMGTICLIFVSPNVLVVFLMTFQYSMNN